MHKSIYVHCPCIIARQPTSTRRRTSECDSSQGADKDKWPERQLAGPRCPVRDQEHPAVDGGQREPREGTGEKCLPAVPAQHKPDAGCQFGIFPELELILRCGPRTLIGAHSDRRDFLDAGMPGVPECLKHRHRCRRSFDTVPVHCSDGLRGSGRWSVN